jgi:hypothetical protein
LPVLTLVDPSEERLAVLGPFIKRMVQAAGAAVAPASGAVREAALAPRRRVL